MYVKEMSFVVANSNVMDVTFGHKMTNKNPQKNYSSCMTKMLMYIIIAPTWLREGPKKIIKKILLSQKKKKRQNFYGETIHFPKTNV